MKKKLLKTIPKLATPTPMMPKRDFGSKTNFFFTFSSLPNLDVPVR
jgi:hypothetical protein